VTLQRTWEPCAADTLDEARNYEAFDHSEDVRLFVDDLLALEGVRGDILDLGTGTALLPIEICEGWTTAVSWPSMHRRTCWIWLASTSKSPD